MKTPVNPSPTVCPRCGRPLPGGGLQGLCPVCLLAQAEATRSGGRPEGAPRFEPPPVAEVAALFPRLEILRLIGAGGMGAVYQARQPDLDRMVALKILPADGPGGTLFEERFNREARALARLTHPNIVSVHEFGRAGRHHYFLMEYVDGANLRQLEQAGRLSPREVLQVIPQICDALQYAHDEGVVHRDIKPENVLVDRRGRVKIADFGLARIVGPDGDGGRLTVDGQVMGTPHYMAPEQVERPLTVDHRADIYSLGVVIYEMLTGDLPLGKFPPPSRKVEVDVRLDAVVLRALENDPERRYQRAGDVKTGVETVSRSPGPEGGAGDAGVRPEPAPVRRLRWAGIPVVVERDGEREVSFEGALGLLFTTMAVAAVGHYLVRWLSGGEHALPRAVWMAGVLTAFWAVRQTFRRPEPRAAVERTLNGTAVLRPSRRPRFLSDYLTLAVLFAVVVGSHYLHRDVIRPMMYRRSATAPQVARPEPVSGALRAELAGGGHVELMAVSLPDGAPNQWWAPDGRAVTGDLETRGLSCPGGGSGWARRMVFRAVDLPAGSDGLYFEAAGGMSVAARSSALLNGRELSGGWTACYSDPSGGRRIEPEVGVAVDPWRPLAAYHPDGRPAGSRRSPGDPHPRLQVHGTSDSPEGARITAVLERESRDWRFRIVAVDASGVEHTERSMSGSLGPSGDDAVVTFTFHGLRLDAVREFVAQARPVRWVRFPGVAMEPSGPRPEGRRPMASRTVSADDDGILSAEFPGLGRVDLLALGQPEAAPGGWWRADGRPVPGPGFAVRGVSDVAVAGRALDLVLRLPDVGEGVTGPLFRFDPDSAAGGGGEVWAGGVPLVGGRPLRVVWPSEAVRGRIRVGFASGPWQVVSHHAPAGGGRIVDRLGALPDPDARIQSVSAGDGGLELTVVSATRTGSDPDRVWRWVAVDRRSGLPTAPSGPGVGSPAGPGEVLTLKFPGLDLAGVAEFQLQARTVEWAEFPLWLEPRSPVPAPVPRVFGDPVERAYDGVVDLDSGRVGRFPGGHGSDPIGGLAEDVAWMAGEGFDLSADLPMPSVLGVVWVPLETDSWTGMTPAQVEERLSNSGVSRVRMESPDGRHDAVFGFRTREGTVGLLRVVGLPGTDRRLVWKRVASPAP